MQFQFDFVDCCSATNKDYKHSGYDRGHLAAAGNHRLSQDVCQQTFLLSNMAPQVTTKQLALYGKFVICTIIVFNQLII